MQLKPIHQQVVAIMGASSGIGRETGGDFTHLARPSVSTWFNVHPAVKWGATLAGSALLCAVLGAINDGNPDR